MNTPNVHAGRLERRVRQGQRFKIKNHYDKGGCPIIQIHSIDGCILVTDWDNDSTQTIPGRNQTQPRYFASSIEEAVEKLRRYWKIYNGPNDRIEATAHHKLRARNETMNQPTNLETEDDGRVASNAGLGNQIACDKCKRTETQILVRPNSNLCVDCIAAYEHEMDLHNSWH
jgi:hypothetical protein